MDTYTIIISEEQRSVFQRAMKAFIAGQGFVTPGVDWREAMVLYKMISNDPVSPLSTTGLNGFVL